MAEEVIVLLYFKSEDDKREFMGQLSDGWGENFCSLSWEPGVSFDGCYDYNVEVFSDDE